MVYFWFQTRSFALEDANLNYELAVYFFESEEYYRSITEIYRLKYYYNQEDYRLDVLLAKNFYLNQNYFNLNKLGNSYLDKNNSSFSTIIALNSLYLLKNNLFLEAEKKWIASNLKESFWKKPEHDYLNPEKAFWLNLVPGLGFVYTKNYTTALVAFVLNSSFIYFLVDSYQQERYTSSFLFFFFEYQFYLGGMRAARQNAENYNNEFISKDRKLYIRIFEKKFGLTKN